MKNISFLSFFRLFLGIFFLSSVTVQGSTVASEDDIVKIGEIMRQHKEAREITPMGDRLIAVREQHNKLKALPVSLESFYPFLYTLFDVVQAVYIVNDEYRLGGYEGEDVETAPDIFDHPYFRGERDLAADLKSGEGFVTPILETLDFFMGFYFYDSSCQEKLFRLNDFASSIMPKEVDFSREENNYLFTYFSNEEVEKVKSYESRLFKLLTVFLGREGRSDFERMSDHEHSIWLQVRDKNIYSDHHPDTYAHLQAFIQSKEFLTSTKTESINLLEFAHNIANALSDYEGEINYIKALRKQKGGDFSLGENLYLVKAFFKLGKIEEAKDHVLQYFRIHQTFSRKTDRKKKGKQGRNEKVGMFLWEPEMLDIAIQCLSPKKNERVSQSLKGLRFVSVYLQTGWIKADDKGLISIPVSLLGGKNRIMKNIPVVIILNSEEAREDRKDEVEHRLASWKHRKGRAGKSDGKDENYRIMDFVIKDRKTAGLAKVTKASKINIAFIQMLFKKNNFSSEQFEVTLNKALAFQKSIVDLGAILERIDGVSSKTTALTREIFDQITTSTKELENL